MLEGEDRAAHALGEIGVARCRARRARHRGRRCPRRSASRRRGPRGRCRRSPWACATIWACRCSPIRRAVSGGIVSVSDTAWAITSARSGGRSDRRAAALATLSLDRRIAQISALSSSRMGRSCAIHRREAGPGIGAVADLGIRRSPSRAMAEICGFEDFERVMHAARHDQREVVERAGELPHDIGQRGAVDLAEARHGARQHALMRGRKLVDAGRHAVQQQQPHDHRRLLPPRHRGGRDVGHRPEPVAGPVFGISPIVASVLCVIPDRQDALRLMKSGFMEPGGTLRILRFASVRTRTTQGQDGIEKPRVGHPGARDVR
jgi:hypothetical protein